jgi:hypothetical protein
VAHSSIFCVFFQNFLCISSSSYFSSLFLLSTLSSDPLHLYFSLKVRQIKVHTGKKS